MNIFDIEASQPKLNIFDIETSQQPANTQPSISIEAQQPNIIPDITPTKDTIDIQSESPVDTTSTEPTELAPALGTIDKPVYKTKQEATELRDKAYKKASVEGTPYIDPISGENYGLVSEPGLEDVSLDAIYVLPITKLGLGTQREVYDAIYEDILSDKPGVGLQAAANLIAHTNKTIPEEVLKSVEHLAPEDRTIALAMGTQDKKFIGFVKEAIKNDDILRSRLQDEVVTRKDIIKALGQTKEELKYASNKWNEMLDIVNQEPVSYPLGNIADDLDYIDTLYGVNAGKASTLVNRLKLASEDGATITLGEALDLRKGVNRLLRNAQKGTDEIKHLTNIKDQIDSFIASATRSKPELKKLIDETNELYARTVNNYHLTALIKSAEQSNGALDYSKLLDLIEKEGLKSPEVKKAIEIAKLFDDKYKLDKHLGDAIVSKGSGRNGLGYIGVGTIARWVLDNLTPYNRLFYRSRFKGLAIQKEIRNSIKRSDSIWEFLDSVKANSKVPNTIKESLEKTLIDAKRAVEIKRLEYNGEGTILKDENPLYTTEKGTISKDATQAALHDAQLDLVRKTLGDGYDNTVINRINEILNGKRFEDVMRVTADRMKAADIQGNMQRLKKTVEREVDIMVKRINKDYGVTLPKSEIEKLYKMKLEKMLWECEQ